MPSLGFIDHDLDNFHAEKFLEILRGDLAARGWEVGGACATDEARGRAWCEANGVTYVHDPAALDERVDAYMVLAPSNPELHPALCDKVLAFGKPVYVDKPFAADSGAAEALFAAADANGVVMQTSSALRYTNVQAFAREHAVRHMVAWCAGSNFPEYAIHPVEMVVSCMGTSAARLMRRGDGDASQLLIDFDGGRTAVVNVYCNTVTHYAAAVTTEDKTEHLMVDTPRMFVDLASAVLDMFESGKANVPRDETLLVRRILDTAADPAALDGFVDLSV